MGSCRRSRELAPKDQLTRLALTYSSAPTGHATLPIHFPGQEEDFTEVWPRQDRSEGRQDERAVRSRSLARRNPRLSPDQAKKCQLCRCRGSCEYSDPYQSSRTDYLSQADLQNLLLPRSTGLLYCLRALSLTMPNLTLYDVTIGYEGVPPAGYAQDYYTLASTFGLHTPSPRVHLHLRKYRLADVPIGAVREGASAADADAELSQQDRAEFERWLRSRWEEKDDLMSYFYERGEFPQGKQGSREVAIKMRGTDWGVLASIPLAIAAVVLAVMRLF